MAQAIEAFHRSPLPTLERLVREYGDLVAVPVPGSAMFVLAHPLAVEHILLRNANGYIKSAGNPAGRRLFGGALQLSNGERVKQMRRLLAPALAVDRLLDHTALILEEAEAALDTWTLGPMPGLTQVLMEMLLPILVRMYFGTDRSATREFGEIYSAAIDSLPDELSGFAGDRGDAHERAVHRLDAAIDELLRSRVHEDRGEIDFAGQYLRQGLSPAEVRDELVTMMAASYRTMGMALVQTLRLVAEHPDVESDIAAEAVAMPRSCPDPRTLTRTGAAIKESLRLCPPAGLLTRIAVREDSVDGWRIPRGSTVFLSPWLTQRNARFFPAPLQFLPQRWALDTERQVGCAYFPFGAGGRSCIGSVMSDVMLRLVLCAIVRRFRLEVVPASRDRDAWPLLMADGGLRASVYPRAVAVNRCSSAEAQS